MLYNYNERNVEKKGLYEYCQQKGILLISYRSLGLGVLCGQEEDAEHGDLLLVDLARKYEKTSGQIALNWLLHKGNTLALIKSTNSTHINENVGAIGWKMTKEEYERLDKRK
jgi:diketogulonate reductase-like aldo/keto reductase